MLSVPRHTILDLDMDPGDWVVSASSTDSMFGKVALRFQDPQALTLLGAMEEIPPSQWEVEPFSQLDIKVMRRDTRMIQRVAMDLNHLDDIHGKVFFVLEPLCTPFETTFTLTHTSTRGGKWCTPGHAMPFRQPQTQDEFVLRAIGRYVQVDPPAGLTRVGKLRSSRSMPTASAAAVIS